MRTANPALSEDTFRLENLMDVGTNTMTLGGTVGKTFFLTAIVVLTGAYTWNMTIAPIAERLYEAPADGQYMAPALPPAVITYTIVGLIGGLVMAMIIIFKKTTAPYLSPVYAAFEGLAIGGISAGFETQFPGIVVQAVGGTAGTLVALLAAYSSGLIKPTENFKLGVVAATGGICLIYLVQIVLSFFGSGIPMIHESGTIGILFSLFVVVIAALNLVLDFDFIEQGVANKCPKYMEWYAAFGLLVTLIWLYLEMLRLIAKLRSRE